MFSKLLSANKSWNRIRGIALNMRFQSSQPSLDVRLARRKPVLDSKFEEGNVIEGFKITEVASIDEMYLQAIRLEHLKTGAQYVHLQRDDNNNVFATGFQTTPMNSTGLPHILEHTVLCGSEKYPCRDPFFKMLRRSLATFMNAMTAPDFTVYPFSTQNPKDFRNLQSVYLDLVFKPNLRLLDFQQEGWRLEHADVNDPKTPIIFKGVVFNEMKGVFVEDQNRFFTKMLNSLLPSHTYGVISGGDPLEIPNLTHKDLVDFHSCYYHPSNAKFYSYGNFPLEDHLKFVNQEYLSSSERIDTSAMGVPSEKRWTEPKKEHISARCDPRDLDSDRLHSMAIGVLCNDIKDVKTTFELSVLTQLLFKGPNAPFYKNLVEKGIGTGFSPASGYESQLRDTMFVVGLQGMRQEDFSRMEKAYEETIEDVMNAGFLQEHVGGVLHGIEIGIKHQTANFGLNLLFGISPLWNHGGDVIQSLRINEALEIFKSELSSNPKYLQELTQKYFWKNPHKLTLTMSPDEKFEVELLTAENRLLKKKVDKLSEAERKEVFKNGLNLLKEQEKKDDVGVLPTLKIEDLKKDVDRYIVEDLKLNGVPIQVAVQPTNEVLYYNGILNTQMLSPELKELLPLFNHVVTKMGTKKNDYLTFDRKIQLKTAGINFSHHVAEEKSSVKMYEEGILVQSHCLQSNSNEMLQLLEEVFNSSTLDNVERFGVLVKMIATDLSNGIADAGHHYAMNSASSLVSPAGKLKESLSGLEYINRMKKVSQLPQLYPVLEKIQNIAEKVLNKSCFRSCINVTPEHKDLALKQVESFYETLEGVPSDPIILSTSELIQGNENAIHHVMPYNVNYTSKAILTVPYVDPDFAVLNVLAKLISNIYLHSEIREKGGAYGGGAKLSSDGIFTFYSYRDPKSTKTFDIYDKAYEFLKNHPIPESDLVEAKLAVFQGIDSPVPPGQRGFIKFLYGITDDDMQKRRERVKAVTKEQILEAANKYLKPGVQGVKIGRALIGPKNPDLLRRDGEKWTISDGDE